MAEPALEGEAQAEVSRELQDAVLAGLRPTAAQTFTSDEVASALEGLEAAGLGSGGQDGRLLEAARSLGAQALVRLRFGQVGQFYEIEAQLLLATDGRQLGSVSQTCQVCTWTEALETATRAGVGLRPSLPGLVSFVTTPPGASIAVDGAAAQDAGQLALPPGRHTIEATLAGHVAQSREVEVVSGARVEVQLALAPSQDEPPAQTPTPPSTADQSGQERPRRSRSLAIGGGLAAGLAVAALVPGVLWLALEGRCAIGSQEIDGLCVDVYYTWPQGLALTLTGVGLASVAAVLLVLSHRARRSARAVVPAVSVAGPSGGFAFALMGRF